MFSQERQKERDFIIDVIKLYEKLPALWNIKSKDYTDRNKKQYQYDILLRKYRERYRGADKLQLLRKVNSLRTNFRKEVKRINEASKNGEGEICPTLWYYDEMKFLISQDKNCEENLHDLSKTASNSLKEQKSLANTNQIQKKNQHQTKQNSTTTKRLNLEQNKLISLRTVPKRVALTSNNIITPVPRQLVPEQKEFEQIAAFWTIELQKMNATQQLFAKKAINDILFEGQLGNLHRNSIEINRISQEKPTSRVNASLTSPPSIMYEDEYPNISNIGNLKFEIGHIDPIEIDNISSSTFECSEEDSKLHNELDCSYTEDRSTKRSK